MHTLTFCTFPTPNPSFLPSLVYMDGLLDSLAHLCTCKSGVLVYLLGWCTAVDKNVYFYLNLIVTLVFFHTPSPPAGSFPSHFPSSLRQPPHSISWLPAQKEAAVSDRIKTTVDWYFCPQLYITTSTHWSWVFQSSGTHTHWCTQPLIGVHSGVYASTGVHMNSGVCASSVLTGCASMKATWSE